jgi:hypothetical protein
VIVACVRPQRQRLRKHTAFELEYCRLSRSCEPSTLRDERNDNEQETKNCLPSLSLSGRAYSAQTKTAAAAHLRTAVSEYSRHRIC